jgi:tetratricopeptide (TPR) repeat protein
MSFVLLWSTIVNAQHKELLEGTNAYQAGEYDRAAISFLQAIEADDASIQGNFNLGNTYYKSKKYEDAVGHYQDVISQSDDDLIQSKAFYNLGNSYLSQAQEQNPENGINEKSQEQLKNAIEAYKNALRKNTEDYDAKNNLGVAYKMLRQQQQQQKQQQQQQQNQDENQEKEKEQQEDKPQDENQENEEEKDEEQKGDQQPPEQDKEDPIKNQNDLEKGKPQDMEKDQIERMLKRIEEEDKKVQEKLMKRRKGDRVQIEKDW